MKFKTPMIIGLVLAIFFIILLLPQQNLYATSWVLLLFTLDIIYMLVLFFFEPERTIVHWFNIILLVLSIMFVIIFRLGKTTFATFLLGGIFIVAYVLLIILLALDYEAKFIDKFIDALAVKEKK